MTRPKLKILQLKTISYGRRPHLPQILNLSLRDQIKIENCSKRRQPQNIKIGIVQQPLTGSSSNVKPKLREPNQNWKLLEIKTTSNTRRPQNIKSGICEQPLIGSYSNFKLKLKWRNPNWKLLEMNTTSNVRWPQNIESVISQRPLIGSYLQL